MDLEGYIITGVKVINIIEENATAIEKMTNKAIEDIHANKTKILDIVKVFINLRTEFRRPFPNFQLFKCHLTFYLSPLTSNL